MPDTQSLPSTITFEFKGNAPYEQLVVTAINAHMEFLRMLPEGEMRNKQLAMDLEDGQFWHNIFSPARSFGDWLAKISQPK